MEIHSLAYKDRASEWELETISFRRLTLLVGASGVGKTQILRALLNLKSIAKGKSLNGIEWVVKFSTKKGHTCEWRGSFENKGFNHNLFAKRITDTDEKDLPSIEQEQLIVDGKTIISRDAEGIFFNEAKTVKLNPKESVINLLKEEEQIKEIYDSFKRILFDDNTAENYRNFQLFPDEELKSKIKKYNTLEKIRNSDENLKIKLYLSSKNEKSKFNEIRDVFVDVFPYVEDVRIEPLASENEDLPSFFRDIPVIQIKEVGVNNWINEGKISSGMFRTLMHIAELHLCADGTVILIDEFENSLGINCIDALIDNIVSYKRNLQFILTSHHPYIINNISPTNWMLITRKAGVVKNDNAEKMNIGKSKHEAFTQLINMDDYCEGVDL